MAHTQHHEGAGLEGQELHHTVCHASTAVFSLGPAVNPEVLENSSAPADLGSRGLHLGKPSFSSGRASYLPRVQTQALQSKLCC